MTHQFRPALAGSINDRAPSYFRRLGAGREPSTVVMLEHLPVMKRPPYCAQNRRHRSAILTAACTTMTIVTAAPAPAATIINTFSGWTLYAGEDGAGKICFLAAIPTQTQPPAVMRETALTYVSAWPKDGVKSEVSFKIGFPIKKGTDPFASIIGQSASSYKLFVKDDRAYVADTTQELKLLEALKKGSKLTIQTTASDGTTVIDTYSLQGITAALQALAVGCP